MAAETCRFTDKTLLLQNLIACRTSVASSAKVIAAFLRLKLPKVAVILFRYSLK